MHSPFLVVFSLPDLNYRMSSSNIKYTPIYLEEEKCEMYIGISTITGVF